MGEGAAEEEGTEQAEEIARVRLMCDQDPTSHARL